MKRKQRNEKGQFAKGLTPWNKGLKNVNNSRPNSTSFQGGKSHPKYKPIGSERIERDGLVVIKTDERRWVPKHRHFWELKNGAVPKGHVVIFANGDRSDFTSGNLIAISRKQLAIMNKNKLISNDSELTKTGVAIADLLLATGKAKKRGEKDG